MGYADRKLGPGPSPSARSFGSGRIWGLVWTNRPPQGVEQMFENPPGADIPGKMYLRRGHEFFVIFFRNLKYYKQ